MTTSLTVNEELSLINVKLDQIHAMVGRRPEVTFDRLDEIFTKRVGSLQMNRGEFYEAVKELMNVVVK